MSEKKFNVRITQCYLIKNIEATDADEARRKASEDYTWGHHLEDCIIDVEEEGAVGSHNYDFLQKTI
jgi:hypothetical protein|tara:strand:+ start:20 stop:220 length:201 start_codon:yes stop_codon:yes gene_type:complete